MAKYYLNEKLHGVEISFDSKPNAGTLDTLKSNGFKWNPKKKVWYSKQTPERIELAKALAENTEPETAPTQPEQKKNKFGVVVGDIFSMSWGYEQTQNDFFQVVALAGKESVRVVHVNPPIVKTEAYTGMSEDRFYNISRELLPPKESSLFIKDQVKGDLKRIKSYYKDGSHPQFCVTSYADAHYCEPGEHKTYCSWYY